MFTNHCKNKSILSLAFVTLSSLPSYAQTQNASGSLYGYSFAGAAGLLGYSASGVGNTFEGGIHWADGSGRDSFENIFETVPAATNSVNEFTVSGADAFDPVPSHAQGLTSATGGALAAAGVSGFLYLFDSSGNASQAVLNSPVRLVFGAPGASAAAGANAPLLKPVSPAPTVLTSSGSTSSSNIGAANSAGNSITTTPNGTLGNAKSGLSNSSGNQSVFVSAAPGSGGASVPVTSPNLGNPYAVSTTYGASVSYNTRGFSVGGSQPTPATASGSVHVLPVGSGEVSGLVSGSENVNLSSVSPSDASPLEPGFGSVDASPTGFSGSVSPVSASPAGFLGSGSPVSASPTGFSGSVSPVNPSPTGFEGSSGNGNDSPSGFKGAVVTPEGSSLLMLGLGLLPLGYGLCRKRRKA